MYKGCGQGDTRAAERICGESISSPACACVMRIVASNISRMPDHCRIFTMSSPNQSVSCCILVRTGRDACDIICQRCRMIDLKRGYFAEHHHLLRFTHGQGELVSHMR